MTLEISPSMADDVMVSLPVAASCLRRKSRPQSALADPRLGQHPEISQHR
jgi:hypothetical protein